MSFVTVRTFAPGRYAEGGVPWECMYERAGSQKALRRGYCRFRFRAVRHAAHAELGPPCRRSGQLLSCTSGALGPAIRSERSTACGHTLNPYIYMYISPRLKLFLMHSHIISSHGARHYMRMRIPSYDCFTHQHRCRYREEKEKSIEKKMIRS